MQNRKERRAMEKQSGLFGLRSLMNKQETEEYILRKKMVGKQIELHNKQESESGLITAASEREQQVIAGLISSGHSEESAVKVVEKNNLLNEQRLAKQAKKARTN